MNNHETFLHVISNKKYVKLTFNSKEKGTITRKCVPFDFGASSRNLKINPNKYRFYDLDRFKGPHPLPVLPEQIIEIKLLDESFNPASYITWKPPYNWFVKRDWGIDS